MNEKQKALFGSELSKRLERGAAEYGEASFDKSEEELFAEIEQGAIDIAGWAYVLFCKELGKRITVDEFLELIGSLDGNTESTRALSTAWIGSRAWEYIRDIRFGSCGH